MKHHDKSPPPTPGRGRHGFPPPTPERGHHQSPPPTPERGHHRLDRSKFDHVGIVTERKQPRETWVEATRVWVTNPREHPYNVEFLRFEPDTPVTGPLRTEPHVAYRVDDLERAIEGHDVVLEPFDASGRGFVRVAFVDVGGALVELMQYANPDEEGWF